MSQQPQPLEPSTGTRMTLKEWAAVMAALFMFGFGVHQYIETRFRGIEERCELKIQKAVDAERDRNSYIYELRSRPSSSKR